MTEGCLAIDTNIPGFFKEAECASLHFFLEEFGSRLKLEMFLLALLTPRKKP